MFHERADDAYEVEPAFLAYMLIEVPVEILSAIFYTIFTMLAVGLYTTATTFFCMVFAVFSLVNVGESIGIAFCSIVHHVGFSVSMTNAVLGIFVVMSGLLSANMPVVLDRINRISPIPYLTRLLATNEFAQTVTFTCTQEEIVSGRCLYRTGSDVLQLLAVNDSFAFEYDRYGLYVGVTAALFVIYRLIAYVVLKVKAG